MFQNVVFFGLCSSSCCGTLQNRLFVVRVDSLAVLDPEYLTFRHHETQQQHAHFAPICQAVCISPAPVRELHMVCAP